MLRLSVWGLVLASITSGLFCAEQSHTSLHSNKRELRGGGKALQLGAIVMLISDWKVPKEGSGCHINTSMDALVSHWRPHNPYPVILMDTKPWSKLDMAEIRCAWKSLDFKFINIGLIFESQPTISESEFLGAGNPLGTLSFKQKSSFFFQGFTQVRLLMNYRYLMRLDESICLKSHVEYDLFQSLWDQRAAYAYSHILYEPSAVTSGLYGMMDTYVADELLQWKNPALHEQTIKSRSFPSSVPAFNTNFEVINTVRYRDNAVTGFVDAVVASQNIFHHRWGDAPLRFALAMLFWTENEVVHLQRFELVH